MDFVRFELNGNKISVEIESGELLIDTLRNRLNIKSVKQGCGIGECGTCTVLLDNEPVCSCILLSKLVENRKVMTVEGLKHSELKSAFISRGAVQCGFCTPGMLLTAYSIILKKEKLTDAEIKEKISGNLCRCTGYNQIVEAIKDVL